jgi:hypothetical protein
MIDDEYICFRRVQRMRDRVPESYYCVVANGVFFVGWMSGSTVVRSISSGPWCGSNVYRSLPWNIHPLEKLVFILIFFNISSSTRFTHFYNLHSIYAAETAKLCHRPRFPSNSGDKSFDMSIIRTYGTHAAMSRNHSEPKPNANSPCTD